MEKMELNTVITETVQKAVMMTSQLEGVDFETCVFTVVQPLKDGQGIIVKLDLDEEGERTVKVSVSDTIFVLDAIENTLDVFDEEDA